MDRGARVLVWATLLLIPNGALGQEGSRGFLTPQRDGDPVALVLEHARTQRSRLGLAPRDLDDALTHRYRTGRTGTTHVRIRQRLRGIEVVNGDLTVAVRPDGRLLHRRSGFVPDLARRANTTVPSLTAAQAVALAALDRGLPEVDSLRATGPALGPSRLRDFEDPRISLDPIPVRLMLLPLDSGEARLVWHLVLRVPDQSHWWSLYVDAVTGEVLKRSDRINQDSYKVFPLNLESPSEGGRSVISDPADSTASPLGWHDDGTAEFEDTRGNNVWAQEDTDANNVGGNRPDGGPSLDFDETLDLSQAPNTYTDASTTNLFYWNNVLHDIFYQYGFDEASGNFQANNFGKGGGENDPLQADSQDGFSTNNANFGTPPDGSVPLMQMFVWVVSSASDLNVHSPASIAGNYPAGMALFGPLTCGGLTGDLVAAIDVADGNGPATTDGCSAITNSGDVAGKIALIDRGTCLFSSKVLNAEAAGAIAVIIANNAGDATLDMSSSDPAASSIAIPSIFIGQSDGAAIRAELPGVNATLTSCAENRDSALDSGIIIHEYAHGISNRLTNGAANVDCLDNTQSGGMGEGWGDFFALALTAKTGAQGTDSRGIGTYVLGQSPAGPGIRSNPYSTDLSVNPLTFTDISALSFPHGIGEVWAATLWDLYWNLVDLEGWDSDLYAGTGGNNLALQLVMDGMKLQSCNPTFIEARDAILDADTNVNASAHHCQIWTAFAKRGMGEGASTPSSNSTATTESFTVPAGICADLCSGVICSALDSCHTIGTCNPATGVCSNPNAASGTACGDPATTECSLPDTCDGAGICSANDSLSGSSCGDAGTQCTVQDSCNGSGACTDNGFANLGTNCGDAGTECTVQDSCNGSGACTDNGFANLGTNCGAGTTECSAQDTCNGAGTCQPNDSSSATTCGSAGTDCVIQDLCDGSGSCTDNGFVADGSACDDGAFCNGSDSCSSGSCVTQGPAPCVGPDGDGDCAESCDESSDTCTLADVGGSSCDDAELCTANDICDGAGGCAGSAFTCNNPLECETGPGTCTGSGCSYPPSPEGAPCNDSLFCTVSDACTAGGACQGQPSICSRPETCSEAEQACLSLSVLLARAQGESLETAPISGIASALTIEAWLKLASQPSEGEAFTIVSKFEGTSDTRSFHLFYQWLAGEAGPELTLSTYVDGTSATGESCSVSVTLDSDWNHVAASYDAPSGQCQFYLGGANIGSPFRPNAPAAIFDSNTPIRIGAHDVGLTNGFNGHIDDVRVWNVTRSSTEIGDSFGCQDLTLPQSGLLGHWRLDGNNLDSSGNDSNLTANNGTFSESIPCADSDADGISDASDICPSAFDPLQTESGTAGTSGNIGAACLCGDADDSSTINIIDAQIVSKVAVGTLPMSSVSIDLVEVNQDGNLDIVDAQIIAKATVGIIEKCDLHCTLAPDPSAGDFVNTRASCQ